MCKYIGMHLRSAYRKGFGGFMSDILWGHSKDEGLPMPAGAQEGLFDGQT